MSSFTRVPINVIRCDGGGGGGGVSGCECAEDDDDNDNVGGVVVVGGDGDDDDDDDNDVGGGDDDYDNDDDDYDDDDYDDDNTSTNVALDYYNITSRYIITWEILNSTVHTIKENEWMTNEYTLNRIKQVAHEQDPVS